MLTGPCLFGPLHGQWATSAVPRHRIPDRTLSCMVVYEFSETLKVWFYMGEG